MSDFDMGRYDVKDVQSVYADGRIPTRLQVDNPVEVYAVLTTLCDGLRSEIDATTKPQQLYPLLKKHAIAAMGNTDLPERVRREVGSIFHDMKQTLRAVTSTRDIAHADDDTIAQTVLRDVKHVGHVQLPQADIDRFTIAEPAIVRDIHQLQQFVDTELWFPPMRDAAYKGGAARVALKMYHRHLVVSGHRTPSVSLDQLDAMIEAELPLDDHDVVLPEDDEFPIALAKDMGADPDGVEYMKAIKFPHINQYMGTRDLATNQALLVERKLYMTEEALDALDSGEAIPAMSTTPGIFGREAFVVNGRHYWAANTLYRLVKTVCDGKHAFFQGQQFNFDDIGLDKYWLVLVRKWLKNGECAKRMAKAYSCAKQMGVAGTDTPEEFWRRQITLHPDFDFNSEATSQNVGRWIVKRLVTFVEKRLRRTFGIHSGNEHFTSTNETTLRIEPTEDDYLDEDVAAIQELVDLVKAGKADTIMAPDNGEILTWEQAIEPIIEHNIVNHRDTRTPKFSRRRHRRVDS